ncbi:MAG: thiamine pyrophosphate-dependent enzyme [Dehalococcoidia bacterium]
MSDTGVHMSVDSALGALARRRQDQVVVSTMTAIAPWRAKGGTDRDLVCQGFMGGASTFGLGVALARPDVPVWIIDGDGSLAMQLGSLVTIANAAPRRFLHVVMHNGVYDTSGAQPLPAEGRISFTGLAESAGYAKAVRFEDAESFDASLDELLEVDGPVLVELMTQPLNAFYTLQPPSDTPRTPPLAQTWPGVHDALARDA